MTNITSAYFSIYQRKQAMSLRFVTRDFFIDAAYRTLFIFNIKASSAGGVAKDASLVGSYYSSQSVNSISTLDMVYIAGETDIYAFELLSYADMLLQKLVIPLRASTAMCSL